MPYGVADVEYTVDVEGVTQPVLDDNDPYGEGAYRGQAAIGNNSLSMPYHVLVGRDMTILHAGGSPAQEHVLLEALEEEWPDVLWPENPPEIAIEEPGIEMGDASPFAADPVTDWEASSACSAGGNSSANWAALLLLLPALAIRRRR